MEPRFGHHLAGISILPPRPTPALHGLALDTAKSPSEQQAEAMAAQVVRHKTAEGADELSVEYAQDFGHIRIHTGSQAASSAKALNALAYTVGHNIVFGEGQFSPETEAGRSLLAHELTHVVQQRAIGLSTVTGGSNVGTRAAAPPILQKKGAGTSPLCGVGVAWSCATSSACMQPDVPPKDPTEQATSRTLKVMIDVEAPSAEEVTASTVGHTYVEFSDSTGAVFTYGFYPDKSSGTPDPLFKPTVAGCMVHPDTAHKACVDYEETFSLLNEAEYNDALNIAQTLCKAPPPYNLQTFNCTTFAKLVAEKAKRSLPPIRGKVGSGMLSVTADNPNTLLEGLLDRDVPSRHAQSDTEIREWVSAASNKTIGDLPVGEMIRLINRLLDGWVSEGDIAAVEKICASVTTASQMVALRTAVGGRESELNAAQGGRLHTALNRI
jgi:hypothetical protein